VSGFSRTVISIIARGLSGCPEGRHLALRAFRQTEKTALRFDPDAGRGGPTDSNIAPINDRHSGDSSARVTFEQTAAKRLAPRRFS
jgi:hypothetical protein